MFKQFLAGLVRAGALLLLFGQPAFAQPRPPAFGASDAPFAIRSAGRCLEVNEPQLRVNGGRVQLGVCDGRASQGWRLERGRLLNGANNRCLDLHGPDAGLNGARIQAVDCHGGANQGWHFERGQWFAQADGRCLDVDRNGVSVLSWDCNGSPGQQWALEGSAPLAPPAQARDIEAGPLFNQGEAERKCPAVCLPGKWNGQWRTTIAGRMSVCGCQVAGLPMPQGGAFSAAPVGGAGPWPLTDRAFDDLLQAMQAESFAAGKLNVLQSAARDNHFVIDQLKRIVQSLTFPSDKMRAMEIVAPRVLDRNNAFTLYSVFDFDMERQQARAIFDRLK